MREIKFRGKSTKTGKWLFGDLIHNRERVYIAPIGEMYFNGETECDFSADPATVGQFTGLRDKNGKEIYEGDVVKWDDDSEGRYWRFAVVEINPDIQFNCAPINEAEGRSNSSRSIFGFAQFAYKSTYLYLTVIGNIYDDKHLLNQ